MVDDVPRAWAGMMSIGWAWVGFLEIIFSGFTASCCALAVEDSIAQIAINNKTDAFIVETDVYTFPQSIVR
jgi:hypothetical protein